MELGLYTFVENTPSAETGRRLPPAGRLQNLMEEVVVADEAGLEIFGSVSIIAKSISHRLRQYCWLQRPPKPNGSG